MVHLHIGIFFVVALLPSAARKANKRTFDQTLQRFLDPPLPPLCENGLQVTFKQVAGVVEVLFGVGTGGGDAVKGLVEEGDDAVLFGEWRQRDWNFAQTPLV